jgi:hypothetical protein
MKRFTITKNLSTHGGRLERWLGADTVAQLSNNMKLWPGPPIAVSGVHGSVWAHGGGDFHGLTKCGEFLSAIDFAAMQARKIARNFGKLQRQNLNAGFPDLTTLLENARVGKMQTISLSKTMANAVSTPRASSFWAGTGEPAAGSVGSAAPGGRVCDRSTTGALPLTNPISGENTFFVGSRLATGSSSITNGKSPMLLYDRLFDVVNNASDTSAISVTGVPTRYQSSTPSDPDFAGGNFCFIEANTLQSALHTWTVCRYRNQAGTDSQIFPPMNTNIAGVSRLDHPSTATWFMPMADGDFGVMDLDQIQIDTSLTGFNNFVIGHPIAWIPIFDVTLATVSNNINSAFNLVRIFDDACLSILCAPFGPANFTNLNGYIQTVSG